MSVTYQIFAEKGLVYVRYIGHVNIAEADAAIDSYRGDPAYAPGQRQLVDLAAATSWEHDFPRLIALQAKKAGAFMDPAAPVLVVAHAPNETARKIADYTGRSWDGIDAVVFRVAATETDALEMLGLAERSFDDLLATA